MLDGYAEMRLLELEAKQEEQKVTMRKHLGYTPQFCLRKLEGVEEPDFDKRVYPAKIWHNQSR